MKFKSSRSWVAQTIKNPPAMQETRVWSLGWEGKAIHSSILAWRIPRTEESDGLQSTGLQSQTWLSNEAHTRLEDSAPSRQRDWTQQTGRCAYLVEAQVVHDRGRRVEDHPFRAHHQSEAVEGLEQKERRRHSHDITRSKNIRHCFWLAFQPFPPCFVVWIHNLQKGPRLVFYDYSQSVLSQQVTWETWSPFIRLMTWVLFLMIIKRCFIKYKHHHGEMRHMDTWNTTGTFAPRGGFSRPLLYHVLVCLGIFIMKNVELQKGLFLYLLKSSHRFSLAY